MQENDKEILLKTKSDRRLLSYVPDKNKVRSDPDRRNFKRDQVNINEFIKASAKGVRYEIDYPVQIICHHGKEKKSFSCQGIDISMTGILLETRDIQKAQCMATADKISLDFTIEAGTMPEGMEMKINIEAELMRTEEDQDGLLLMGMRFAEELSVYNSRKKGRYLLFISSLFLFFITATIILMRTESVIYFKFKQSLYLYSIVAASFLLSRYFFAIFYRPVEIDPSYNPGVTILIPCFNEEKWIERTIMGCVNQDYPLDKLEVIVIDDSSTDQSREKIKDAYWKLCEVDKDFEIGDRLKYLFLEENVGKRKALAQGLKKASHDLIVFVDSDSFLDPFAIRNLVQPFKDPKMGGVSGRTDVANTYTNTLTKIQSVRYYIAFRVMKAAESIFDTVTCLSGPLACYRKEIILENLDAWLNQTFLGYEATFGDDRAMTNFTLKNHRTSYQDTAVCYTIVPSKHSVFLRQQMRWKRSWLRESLIAAKFMWKKEPFAALTFYMGIMVPVLGPIIVFYNLIYVPFMYEVFPKTFLTGLALMAMLMSFAQLLLRKSSTWFFGFLFVVYYEAVLLWQMPIAWFTFYKSNWGTRGTSQDQEISVNV